MFKSTESRPWRLGAATAVLLGLLVPFAAAEPPAEDIPNRFDHLTIANGLSQGSALTILQDRQGFIWVGTEDGLNRYDGFSFKIYRPTESPNSLSDRWVRALYEDSQGVLWVGTLNGLNRYDRKRDNFLRFLNKPIEPQSLSHNSILAIREDRRGTLWVGTEGGGLNALDPQTGRFRVFLNDPGNPAGLSHNSVFDIREDSDGLLWLATDGGLNRLDPKTGSITRFKHDPRNPLSLSDDRVRAVFVDRNGTLWAGTEGGGLNVFNPKTGGFTRYRRIFNQPRSLSHDNVYTIAQDRDGRLLIGTNDGLNQFHPQTGDFTIVRNVPSRPETLSYDFVDSIYEDRTGILWIGTRGRGINKSVPDRSRFRLFESRPDDPSSLTSNYIRAIAEDTSGDLWIGTEDKGLNRLDRRTGNITRYRHDPRRSNGLSSDNVYALKADGSGGLWIGTLGGGLNRYDPRTGTFTSFRHSPGDPGSLSLDSVRSVLVDKRGTLWVGTEGGGLNRRDAGRDSFVHYRHQSNDASSLGHDIVRALYEDRSGTLWVGTFGGGLNRMDGEKGTFVQYRHDPARIDSLSSDLVVCLNEDAKGNIWIGSPAGLDRLDPKTGTISHFTEKDGLPNNVAYGVLIDRAGMVWVSGNRGLGRLDPGKRTVKTYDVSDGLQGNEFNGGAYFMTAAGEMFFGGTDGLNGFFPERLRDNPYPPPVVITDFQIFNKSVPVGLPVNGRVVLSESILETTDVELRLRDRLISIEFAALHFAAPEKNRYAYRLEGLEDEWNEVSDRRFVSYANLKPGRYTFRVKASNNDGVWNRGGAALRIRIATPLWMAWWFRGLILLGLALTGFTLIRRRITGIRRRTELLEQKVDARTSALRQEITVRKKTEDELERRQKYLEAVLFNSSNAIVTTGTRSEITDWSPGAEKIFGWERAEVLGRNIDDVVIQALDREEALRRSQMTLSGQQVPSAEAVRHRKDGTPINVIVASSPILIGGESIGGMAIYTDITGLKRAEAAAKEASRAKSEFLANMSHEIRTPMNGIFGMTELALETELSTEQREYIESVKISAEALMTIINDILDFSKIEAKKIDLESVPFRLRDTVHAIVSSVALLAEKKGLEIAYSIPADAPDGLLGDPGRLRQVLTNLLGNAIKFTTKGEVVVTLSMEDRSDGRATFHFQVRDTGIGIPADKLGLIFDPFIQADSSTTRVYGGTGLGLTICSQLVGLMNGRIWVESELNQGSAFHFTAEFPIEDSGEEERTRARFDDLRGLPVLIVDDNATNRRILQEMLTHWGMAPTTAGGAIQAMDRLRSAASENKPFKLILTDGNMPEIDGFGLASEIRNHPDYGNLVVMMLSSSGFRGDSARCRSLGLSAYLTKPVKQSQLLDAILLALGTSPDKAAEAPLITRHSLTHSHARFSILLAEDNIINQKLAVRILENRGHKVTITSNGREALNALDRNGFDLLLMDVQMPILDGFQATAEIRARELGTGIHLPIVAMTAHAMKGDREKCLAAGMDDYTSKPLKPIDLLNTLDQVMERFRKGAAAALPLKE
jgi:PAS domain S-box-containing protein